jgi:hypothetical protein
MVEHWVLAAIGIGLIAAAIVADLLDSFRRRHAESSSQDLDQ